jgi:NADPH:quinone reductase-like Zn-dependent oxidoreductase
MLAMRLDDSGAQPELRAAETPQPEAGEGEVLVQVHAAGIIPSELLWYPTTHEKSGGQRVGAVPGHEFSGVVAGRGAGVTAWRVGDEVYGMNDWFREGAMAEYCVAGATELTRKPAKLTHPEAASVPISALTAWQGLRERCRLQPGERVLVHGGAGSVGGWAVQLARLWGAEVVATASAKDLDFVRGLGAALAIDYRAGRFEEKTGQVDVVFDGVGGETFLRSLTVLKEQGRIVTIAASSETANDERIQKSFFIVEANTGQLSEVSSLLDAGKVRALVDRVLPLAEAGSAYAGTAPRSGRGKLVAAIQ